MKCDVLILGGGSAGLAAAIAASRTGARVVLIERHGALGGMATAALVHTICGLYLLRDEPGARPAHRGLPTEFAARMLRAGAATEPVRMGRLDVLPHSPTGFAAVADDLTAECPTLEVRLHTELIAASATGRLEAVDVICRGKRETIEARTVVDASGDAVLASLAGIRTKQAEAGRLQRPAFIFGLHGVNTAALQDDGRIRLAHRIVEAVQAGQLDRGCLGAQFRVSQPCAKVFVTIDLAADANYEPSCPQQLSTLERHGRRLAVQLSSFLRENDPSFASSVISAFPTRVGVRESRRIQGVAVVSGDDVLRGTVAPDEVALGTWPMEIRESNTGPRWRFPDDNRPTSIPLRALKSMHLENLWTAGRCLSCDHDAQAALRVIGTCLSTGQAAGLAAAIEASGTTATAESVRALIQKEDKWS